LDQAAILAVTGEVVRKLNASQFLALMVSTSMESSLDRRFESLASAVAAGR